MNKTKYSIDRDYAVMIGNSWCPCSEQNIKVGDQKVSIKFRSKN